MDIADMKFVYKTHEKKHKGKPAQFVSVAGGVQKRLETNIKYRKSCRISVFDHGRNLSREPSPVPVPQDDFQTKQDHRRQQLEKWKEEKEKRKKEEAAHKKKPFVASVAHAPLKYVPPPPPKVMPSTSSRVTRSQSAKNQQKSKVEAKTAQQSFAPKNAGFRPPQLKVDLALDIQYLALPTMNKQSKATINNKKAKNLPTFDPKLTDTVKSSRSKTNLNSRQTIQENTVRMNTRSKQTTQNTTKAKPAKSSPKKLKKTPKKTIQSSTESSTDMDSQEYVSENSLEKQPNETIQSPILQSRTPRKSIIQASNVTPRNSVPKSESSSEEKLRSPKEMLTMTPEAIAEEAKHISPCVTISRGKDNARRESQRKLKEGLLADGRSDTENVQHFRRQLEAEVARISRLCHTWDEIYEQCELPEFVQEMVLGGVGQARLLMASKLQQFAGLVDRCEARDSCAGLVTPADLQGFWDMVFIQIENVDLRFKALDAVRARGWAAEETPGAAAVRRRPARPQGPQGKAVKPKGNSRIKEMIAAARKAKKEQESATSDSSSSPKPDSVVEGEGEKTFEAGFFCIRSPVRSPAAPATPINNRHNLLKSVLSSEARKASASKNITSFAMLRASLISKSEEIEGIAPLVQTPKLSSINLNATPARSILKSGKAASARKSGKKSIKTVLFNQSDPELNESVLVPEKLTPETIGDSGLSSMDVDKEVDNADKENKNTRRRSKIVRQDATEDSPVMTRSRRKSMQTPKEEQHERPKRAGRQKKMLQESESNAVKDKSEATPNKSSRRKKSAPDEEVVAKATPKRSSRRNKVIEDLIDFATPEPRKRGGSPWRLTTS